VGSPSQGTPLPRPAAPQLQALPERQQLPEGWHYAEDDDWAREEARARRRRIALRAGLAAVAVAAVLAGLVAFAALHYSRGVAALNDHSYSLAASEFDRAKVLTIPYRNAGKLEDEARAAMADQNAAEARQAARTAAVVTQLQRAKARLSASDASGLLHALGAIVPGDLRLAVTRDATARQDFNGLIADLSPATSEALKNAAWDRATKLATALLLLKPTDKDAAAMKASAEAGAALRAKLATAQDAARHGHWRQALRLALAVLAAHKDFPGAATLVADARTALKPKPKPAATHQATTPTTPSTSTSGSSSSGTSPSQPAPP